MTRRRIAASIALAVILYAALAAAWLVVGAAWSRGVATACDVLLSSPGWGARAAYGVGHSGDGPTLHVTVTRNDLPEEATMALSMRGRTYMPAAMALALVAATPTAWRRRATGGALALALVGLFVALQAWLCAVDAVARWPGNGMGFPSWGIGATHFVYLHMCEVPAILVLVPVLAWALSVLPGIGLTVRPGNADESGSEAPSKPRGKGLGGP